MKEKGKWGMRALAVFLGIMAVCTVVSRAADSVLVAQVRTEKPGKGRLVYSGEGRGQVVPMEEHQVFLWPGQQVEWTAGQGSTVKAGECLVQFRMEYLQQMIEKKQAELTQLELQAEQQRVSAMEPARVPASAGAEQNLEAARAQLWKAQEEAARAQAAYDSFLNEAAQESGQEGTQGFQGESAGNGQGRRQELESALQTAYSAVETAQQTVDQAQAACELAAWEDAVQADNAANAAQAAQLGVQSTVVQAEQVRKELEKLQTCQNAGGRICAEWECTVLENNVRAGTFTTGAEILVLGSGGWRLKGQVEAEDRERLKAGVEVEVRLNAGMKKTVKIVSIETGQDGTGNGEKNEGENVSVQGVRGFWYAPLPEYIQAGGGDSFTWSMEIPSEREYEQTIPLSALREDTTGAYCLVLAEEEHMLGTIQTARRVPVTVLEKDAKNAAVTSSLRDTDQMIVSSEKYVREGDRIRRKE